MPEGIDLIWLLLIVLIAEVLGTLGGFGSSVFFVPFASLLFDFHTVLGITAVFHVSSNLAKITLFRKGIDRNLIIKMGLPAVLFVIAGAYLSRLMSGYWLELSLAGFLIIMSALLLLKPHLRLQANNKTAIFGGAISGLAAGLVGTGGAIRGLALASFGLSKDVFIATSAIIDLGIDISRSVVYIDAGYFTQQLLPLIPMLLILSFIGTAIGKYLLQFISEVRFQRVVLGLILVVGISTMVITMVNL
jgi:uncharacterized membrane protein YfcA